MPPQSDRKADVTMKLTHHSDRHWERVIKSLALAIAVGGLALLVPGGGPAQAASPTLEAIQGLPQDWDKTLPANDPGGNEFCRTLA